MIFSRENIMIFSIFSKYQPLYLLFTYFSNSCISSTNYPSLYTTKWCKNIAENFNPLDRAQQECKNSFFPLTVPACNSLWTHHS